MKIKEVLLTRFIFIVLSVLISIAISVPLSFLISGKTIESYFEKNQTKLTLEQRQQREIISILDSGYFNSLWESRKTWTDSDVGLIKTENGYSSKIVEQIKQDLSVQDAILNIFHLYEERVQIKITMSTRWEDIEVCDLVCYVNGKYYYNQSEYINIADSARWKDIWGIE